MYILVLEINILTYFKNGYIFLVIAINHYSFITKYIKIKFVLGES